MVTTRHCLARWGTLATLILTVGCTLTQPAVQSQPGNGVVVSGTSPTWPAASPKQATSAAMKDAKVMQAQYSPVEPPRAPTSFAQRFGFGSKPAPGNAVASPPGQYPGPSGAMLPPPGYPGNGQPPGPPVASQANDQFSLMLQRLAASEDDKKVLAARAQQLESQLRLKDKAIAQAGVEIQEATSQLKRTREELNRWQQEMESLRTKLRSVERENKTTLEAIMKTLEQFLEREKDAAEPAATHR